MRFRRNQMRVRRRGHQDGANWLSFSDLMSALLLIFVLIMFYIMYQYFDMYEINMAEIARQQFDLDQARADLDEQTAKLSEAEQKMIAQQIRLDAAQKELEDAESVLAEQQAELTAAQSLLDEKESEIATQKEALDTLSTQLDAQQAQITLQQQTLDAQRATMDEQQATMDEQRAQLDEQQTTMDNQRAQLDLQQATMQDQLTRLNAQQATMDEQRSQLDAQQLTVEAQQRKLDEQQLTMNAQQARLDQQQQTLESQQLTLEDQQHQIEQLVGLKTRIITSLSAALREANISAQVDPANGAIALESDVLFATNKYELSERGKQFIDRFLPVYLDVLFSKDYQPYVSEVLIEGHTDTAGDYITNLQLSQRRALAVASYVLSDSYPIISTAEKNLLRKLVTANGRSFSDPILDASGNVDMDASRRVVFKFRLTDEQMIQQLKNILEGEAAN